MQKVYILPTGDEIQNGTVRDLDSVEILSEIIKEEPCAQVTRTCPIIDREDAIMDVVKMLVCDESPDLIILIGGSGGGHRYSATLGKDYTHSAMIRYLDNYSAHEIYGKNGHLWTKLICGVKEKTLLINVPGPFVEAQAAIRAFLKIYEDRDEPLMDISQQLLERYSLAMAKAVFEMYPKGKADML